MSGASASSSGAKGLSLLHAFQSVAKDIACVADGAPALPAHSFCKDVPWAKLPQAALDLATTTPEVVEKRFRDSEESCELLSCVRGCHAHVFYLPTYLSTYLLPCV